MGLLKPLSVAKILVGCSLIICEANAEHAKNSQVTINNSQVLTESTSPQAQETKILKQNSANLPIVVDAGTAKSFQDIQRAIDALPEGRQFLATVKVHGQFEVGATLQLPNYTRLDLSEAVLVLMPGLDQPMLANADQTNGNHHIEICGGRLVGNAPAKKSGESHGVSLTRVDHSRITGMEIRQFAGDGIRLNGLGQKPRNAFLSSLVLENNYQSGLNIMWASRSVFVSNVLLRGNKVYGLRSDHSEGSYSNIQADANDGVGIFIRNIFGANYVNLTATRNGKTGILVQGMVASLGSNWTAHNNGTSADGEFSEIVFSSDASLSYGLTAHTAITGICAGSFNNYGKATAKHAIHMEKLTAGASWASLQINSVVTMPTLGESICKPK